MQNLRLDDPRLTVAEKRYLKAVAERLAPTPPPELPPGYAEMLDRVFGSCDEGEVDRWQDQ